MLMLTVLFLSACAGFALFQVLYTRSHKRNLERHSREVARIYAAHNAKVDGIYAEHIAKIREMRERS